MRDLNCVREQYPNQAASEHGNRPYHPRSPIFSILAEPLEVATRATTIDAHRTVVSLGGRYRSGGTSGPTEPSVRLSVINAPSYPHPDSDQRGLARVEHLP